MISARYIGIDVQIARGCSFCVLDHRALHPALGPLHGRPIEGGVTDDIVVGAHDGDSRSGERADLVGHGVGGFSGEDALGRAIRRGVEVVLQLPPDAEFDQRVLEKDRGEHDRGRRRHRGGDERAAQATTEEPTWLEPAHAWLPR